MQSNDLRSWRQDEADIIETRIIHVADFLIEMPSKMNMLRQSSQGPNRNEARTVRAFIRSDNAAARRLERPMIFRKLCLWVTGEAQRREEFSFV